MERLERMDAGTGREVRKHGRLEEKISSDWIEGWKHVTWSAPHEPRSFNDIVHVLEVKNE